jgi:hypothetical protein
MGAVILWACLILSNRNVPILPVSGGFICGCEKNEDVFTSTCDTIDFFSVPIGPDRNDGVWSFASVTALENLPVEMHGLSSVLRGDTPGGTYSQQS